MTQPDSADANKDQPQQTESDDIVQQKILFKAFLKEKKDALLQHLEVHLGCQGKLLINQIEHLEEDVQFWNEMDRYTINLYIYIYNYLLEKTGKTYQR